MSGPRLNRVPLEGGDVPALLARLPTAPGVAQVLGPEGQSLLIGRPANVRRWVAAQLGAGKAPKKGMRPPTNLAPITGAVAYVAASSPFAQRLAFERVMALHVPLSKRRDLKPPVYIHLDPGARFPRLTVRPSAALATSREHLFGPIRSRQAAQAAIEGLHKLFPLRPCDYAFEPATDLALGLGCVFAQVGTCAAPCLVRVSEDAYRNLAARAAAALGSREGRPPELAALVPPWAGAVAAARGLIADRTKDAIEIYPVVEGAVVEEEMTTTSADGASAAIAGLRWTAPSEPRDDMPWLVPWLHGKRTGVYVDVAAGETPDRTAARLFHG